MTVKRTRKQLEKDFLSGKIPFALDESTYKRFSERDTIFARVVWDESFIAHQQPISLHASKRVGKKGYSRIGYAARDAAWTIHDNFPRSFLKRYNEVEDKESSPTDLVSKLSKYQSTDLHESAKIIKRVAKMFGAVDVGICEIDPEQHLVYSNDRRGEPNIVPKSMKYVIVILVEMDHYGIATSPTLPSGIATGHGYSRMTFIVACVGEFLRNLGYQAISAGNDVGISVPLAIKAGLGQLGRNGLLIHRGALGQRVRICKVFTDFPMKTDKPVDIGAIQLCRVCKKCAKHCPSRSIPFDEYPTWESPWKTPSNNNGVYKWYVDVDGCYKFWVANTGDCSNCISVCPFTKSPGRVHDLARFFIKHFHFLNRFWVLLDDLMGIWPWRYGKKKDPDKFWKSKKYLGKKIQ
ncbi:MAG: reductive dehalogenase [Candidatus Hodarchaeales archaeon]